MTALSRLRYLAGSGRRRRRRRGGGIFGKILSAAGTGAGIFGLGRRSRKSHTARRSRRKRRGRRRRGGGLISIGLKGLGWGANRLGI